MLTNANVLSVSWNARSTGGTRVRGLKVNSVENIERESDAA